MLFREVVGQKEIKSKLLQMVNEQKVGHALLFTGAEGTGKLALALALARYLNCEERNGDDSCLECTSCRKYSKLEHPDLHFVFPVTSTKDSGKDPVSDEFLATWRKSVLENPYMRLFQWYEHLGVENKQGSISKNESLQIIRKLSFRNFEARYKVMIIWMAEKMNIHAANKLLKILEEPPPNTVFILIAEDASQIIPTVISRSRIINIPGIDRESMEHALRERHGIVDQAQIEQLARTADGNYLHLLELLEESGDSDRHFDMFVRLMRLCFVPDILGISDWTEEIGSRGREGQKQFLEYALRLIRGNFILNFDAGGVDFLSDREREFSDKFSKFVHAGNASGMYEELNRAFLHIEYNGYGRLVFFDLALKMARLLKA